MSVYEWPGAEQGLRGATAGPAAPDMVALDVLLDRPGFFVHPSIPPSHTTLSSE